MCLNKIICQLKKVTKLTVCKKKLILLLIISHLGFAGFPQFAPPAGQTGSTAIFKDSSCFVGWATACEIQRGYQNIADTALGKTTTGDSSAALGAAGQNGVVSLGDGGSAIISFDRALYNGPGWDFAVFENSFSDYFLELAFVEVSSDGQLFFRFPSVSLTDTTIQKGNFDSLDTRKVNNLAGKYRLFYGTPFDLDELKNEAGLDVNHITHIKITDVVGSIDNRYASRDSYGNKINDPWPTPFSSSGFDLDAVGAIHLLPETIKTRDEIISLKTFPNPAYHFLNLTFTVCSAEKVEYRIYSLDGSLLSDVKNIMCFSGENNLSVDLTDYKSGVYFIQLIAGENIVTNKITMIK